MDTKKEANDHSGDEITCTAAVAWGPGQPFSIEQIRVQPPQKSEVRIKIIFTSICHTDLSAWRGENESQRVYPRILGHEASGVVESVGEDVEDIKEGDHVLTIFNGECGECTYCKSKTTNLCEKFRVDPLRSVMRNDGKTRFLTQDGKPIYHFLNTSTFSEYTVLDSACVVKINQNAPLNTVTLFSCCLSTGIGSTINAANIQQGSTVAVFGLGAVGLAVILGAKARGASTIIGIDINDDKRIKGMGLFERMKLSAKEDVSEQGEVLLEGASPILEATARFVVQPGESMPPPTRKRKNTDEGSVASRPKMVRRQGLGGPGLRPRETPPPSTSVAAAKGVSPAAAEGSSADDFTGSSSDSDESGDSGKGKTTASSDDASVDMGEQFAPDWDLTNGSVFRTPESCREFMLASRTPAEFDHGESLRNRELSNAGCSAIVNGIFSFVEIHSRWVEGIREIRNFKKQVTKLESENASLKDRCDSADAGKEKAMQDLGGAREELCIQQAAVKRLSSELRDNKKASEDRILALEQQIARHSAERKWLITDGIGLAFNKIRDSDECLDLLAIINSLADKVGYNAGLSDGVILAAEGKKAEDATNFDGKALRKLQVESKRFDRAVFPMVGTIAAMCDSDIEEIKAFLTPPPPASDSADV